MKNNQNIRLMVAFVHDALVSAMAWMLAFLLRFNFSLLPEFSLVMWQTLPWILAVQSLVFWRAGLYRGVWRFASIPDMTRIIVAVGLSSLIVTAGLLMLRLSLTIPRAVLVLDPILLILMMGGSRFAYRAWKEHHLYRFTQMKGEPVLVIGAGDAAISLVRELAHSPQWRVVGMLDDAARLHGLQVHGVPVLGGLDKLEQLADAFQVEQVIIALPSATHQSRQKVVQAATLAGLSVLTVPSFDDLVNGKVSVSSVRKVEVEDLLGREPVQLDSAGLHELLAGHVVMVTGAGGSIGSELCRQISKYQPRKLVAFDLSEYALYQLEQEFQAAFPDICLICVVGDVKNQQRVDVVLQRHHPIVVFHAAAYKHVPLMEKENVSEALHNNVYGTQVMARSCMKHGVGKFVLVSTDKAVNPTNVMGASKRLAEMVCQGLQEEDGTRFIIVRFGNVLGSSGSVIPKFREQIAKGGPITVTHPEVTRYFMSIPEAAQLVMQAGLMGEGGEIFVLDMGEPVRIADLAREMIRLSGLRDGEIEIVYSGLRPGEKLYEELLADDEHTLPTPHPKLRIARARSADGEWVENLMEWVATSRDADEALIKQQLQHWVKEYAGDVNAVAAQPVLATAAPTIH